MKRPTLHNPCSPVTLPRTPPQIAAAAEARGMSGRLAALSLGQGQGPRAAALMAEARSTGGWLVLQVRVWGGMWRRVGACVCGCVRV
jgi:hypothetical protein